jgi:two-component system, cell cycle sensor histidine kinase and response regulator CckA
MLAVSENGVGMSTGTIGRIFEPFFTTKELGKGTGWVFPSFTALRESGGNILVYSEPRKGTTFKIHLPSVDAPTETTMGRSDGG